MRYFFLLFIYLIYFFFLLLDWMFPFYHEAQCQLLKSFYWIARRAGDIPIKIKITFTIFHLVSVICWLSTRIVDLWVFTQNLAFRVRTPEKCTGPKWLWLVQFRNAYWLKICRSILHSGILYWSERKVLTLGQWLISKIAISIVLFTYKYSLFEAFINYKNVTWPFHLILFCHH